MRQSKSEINEQVLESAIISTQSNDDMSVCSAPILDRPQNFEAQLDPKELAELQALIKDDSKI